MKKALRWLGIVGLLLVVLQVAVVATVNAFDEKPDPALVTYGEPRAVTVPEAENGYYAMLAMGAGEGGDGMAYAKAWVAEARAAAKENRIEKQVVVERGERPDLCDTTRGSCISAAREKPGEVRTQLEAYKGDLERYEKLLAAPRYEEVLDYPMRVVSSMPTYGPFNGAQKAYLMRAALALEGGDLEAALSAVERDLAFQRIFLENSRTLMGRMAASAACVRDLTFVADLIAVEKAGLVPHVQRLRDMLKPLGANALRLDAALETEFGAQKHLLRDPVASQGVGEVSLAEKVGIRLAYKPQATINLAYRQFQSVQAAADGPPHTIQPALAALAKSKEAMGWWDYIDNRVGNVLVRLASPNFGVYALRLHDVDAYNRLLALRVEMLAAGVEADGAEEFAAKSDARLHDPYTRKPMRWDAEKRYLYFEAMADSAERRTWGVDSGRVFVAL